MILKFIYGFYLHNEYSVFLYKKLFKLKIEEEECIGSPDKINIIQIKSSRGSSRLNRDEVELNHIKELLGINNMKDSTDRLQHINYNNKTIPYENIDCNSNKFVKIRDSSDNNKINDEYTSKNSCNIMLC